MIHKYLAAVLRTYIAAAQPGERLSKTIARIGLDAFKQQVEARLDEPYDDLALLAGESREKAKESRCIGPLEGKCGVESG